MTALPSAFSSPYRAWELGLGALISLSSPVGVASRAVREVVVAAGLAMIVIVVVVAFSEETRFPGLAAALPCLGALLELPCRLPELALRGTAFPDDDHLSRFGATVLVTPLIGARRRSVG